MGRRLRVFDLSLGTVEVLTDDQIRYALAEDGIDWGMLNDPAQDDDPARTALMRKRVNAVLWGSALSEYEKVLADEHLMRSISQASERSFAGLVGRDLAADRYKELVEAAEPENPDSVRRGDSVIQHEVVPMLVEGRFQQRGLGQIAAPFYQGKTVLAIGLALSVANGLPDWFGYRIERSGPVVYVAAEGGAAFQVHITAWLRANPGTGLGNFIIVDEMPVDWSSASSVQRLTRRIEAVMEPGEAPVLVVGDTQIDLIGETDENAPALGRVLRDMRQWAVDRDLFFLLLHHMGHQGGRFRGHSSQGGKADTVAIIEEVTDYEKKLTWEKVKGHERPRTTDHFQIVAVEGTRGAVARKKAAMEAVAEAADGLSDKDEAIINAVRWLAGLGDGQPISKNRIFYAEKGDGKFVTGRKDVMSARVDEMVDKGWLVHEKKSYRIGVLPE